MAAGARPALRRAVAAIRKRYGDPFLYALQLARREGGRPKGGQGALCVRLAQEPSRCLRWGAPGSAGRCWPMPRGGRARVS
jgi:hypothetical protein